MILYHKKVIVQSFYYTDSFFFILRTLKVALSDRQKH